MNKINNIGRYRWIICSLLFFATTINYLDRQVLSLLQPELAEIFGWSNMDYGYITSAFQFTYAIAVVFVGRWIDAVGTKKGYTYAIIIWSLGAALHACALYIGTIFSPIFSFLGITLSISVIGFIIARIALAIGESGNFPAAIKTVGEWFPQKERSLATGILNSGSNIGAVVAPLTVPLIYFYYGWQTTFILVGVVGFIWLIFWLFLYETPKNMLKKGKIKQTEYDYIYKDKIDETTEKYDKVSWFRLLTYRQTWSFFFGKFLTDGVWWFFLFWLPGYLKVQYNIEGTQVVLPLSILYTMTMVGSICGGWFPAYFANKGMQLYQARMRAMLVIALVPIVVLFAQPFGYISVWIPVILIGIGCSAHQAWSANIFTTVSDMFPGKAVASVIGIGTMAGGFSGVLVSLIAGKLLDYYKSLGQIDIGYTLIFTYCALAYILAWCVMKIFVPKFKFITDL